MRMRMGINGANGCNLVLGEEIEAFAPLHLVDAKERPLDAAEGNVRMWGADAHIDAHHAHIGLAAEFFGIKLALGEDAGSVAKLGPANQVQGIVHVRYLDGSHNGAEHFGGEQRIAGREVLDDDGADKKALFVFGSCLAKP